MRSRRSLSGGIGLGLVVLTLFGAATPSLAAETVVYSFAGIEVGFTATTSSFAGTALSDDGDFALWDALVERTAFDQDRNATITGGTMQIQGVFRDLQGVIDDGGTVTNISKNCRRETFAIQGTVSFLTGETGQFQATLIHYGRRVNGQCVIFFATVDGSVEVISP